MIKRNFNWALLTGILMLLGFIGCEQEDRFVGSNVVGDGSAQFHRAYVDLLAQTLGPDTLRADRSSLQNATIGAYDEPVLGRNKSYFYSQVRLGVTNPEFGENAVVDSVILSIPVFAQTTDTLATERRLVSTNYSIENNDTGCSITDTLSIYQTRFKFAMDSIYGNRNSVMTLQVYRVTESLQTVDSARYSNQAPATGELFGSGQINSEVFRSYTSQFRSINSDNDSTVLASDTSAAIRLHLNGMKDFVQQNVVNMEGSVDLGDQISFINNVLKGIRIGVAEDNGFLFNFNPSNISITAYVSADNPDFTDANGNGIHDSEENCPVGVMKPRVTTEFNFITGSSMASESGSKFYNVVNSYIDNGPGTVMYNQTGQPVNYIEGMGGAKVRLSLNPQQIEAIRDSVRNNDWVISQAHFKVYPDLSAQGNWPIPQYLHAYNFTRKALLPDYGNPTTIATENPQAFPFVQISRPYDYDQGYYMLRVTEFIKNIIEDNEPVDDLAIAMGNYIGSSTADYFYVPRDAYFTSQVFNPYRLAIVGTNPSGANEAKKLRLEIFYNKRQN